MLTSHADKSGSAFRLTCAFTTSCRLRFAVMAQRPTLYLARCSARGVARLQVRTARSRNARCFLRCTTASYSAGDFRKQKMKIEDEFGLVSKQGGSAKAQSAVTHAASAAVHPASAGALRVREDGGARCRSASNPIPPQKKAPPGGGVWVCSAKRRRPVATAISESDIPRRRGR